MTGYNDPINYNAVINYNGGSAPAAIVGGHFLPEHHGSKKRTLSNVLTIYNKAQSLSRKETKKLRDAIAEFVEPEIAREATLPDIAKIDYEALERNQIAYERFLVAIDIIQKNIVLYEKQQQEDDELFEIAFLACSIN